MTPNQNDIHREDRDREDRENREDNLDGDCGRGKQAHQFADSELDDLAAADFEMHLVDCQGCQEEIHDALMLDFLDQRAGVSAKLASFIPISQVATQQSASGWGRPALVYSTVAAVAVAATLAIVALRNPDPKDDKLDHVASPQKLAWQFSRALSPTRAIEGRLSFAGADYYRPYDVDRAAPSRIEKIPNHLLGELEDAELSSGLVAAYVLMGADLRAFDDLNRMAESANMLSDQAILKLRQKKPQEALKLATRALQKEPNHGPAEWNRAIALEQLKLPLAAATAFERVADPGQGPKNGWSDEAKRRAAKHRADYDQLKAHWNQALKAIDQLTDGNTPARSLVRSYPGVIRLGFYDAIGITANPELLDKLKETALMLDEVYGGTVLSTHLQRVRSGNLAARGALAKRYAKVLSARELDGDTDLYNDAVSAAQLDIALLTLFYVDPLADRQQATQQQATYLELATKTADPWFELTAQERIIRVRVERGDNLSAVAQGAPAVTLCETNRNMDYRCLRIHYWVSRAYANMYELDPAKRYAALATTQAQRTGDWMMQLPLLSLAAELSGKEDDVAGTGLPVVNAYIAESLERWPACINAIREIEKTVQSLIDQGRLTDAGNELRQLDRRCPNQEPSLERAFIDVQGIGTLGFPNPGEIRASIQVLRQRQLSPSDLQLATYIEGRASSDDNPSIALLRRAIELTPTTPTLTPDPAAREAPAKGDPRIRSYAYTTLAAKAARQGDFSTTIDVLAEEIGIIEPTCAVAFVFENGVAVAAKNSLGVSIGSVDVAPPRGLPQLLQHPGNASSAWLETLFPKRLEVHLRDCKTIDVFAKAPFIGRAVLPPHLSWRFRLTAQKVLPRKPARHLVITDVSPPLGIDLPQLSPSPQRHADVIVRGSAATPTRVKNELRDATIVEIHAHGVASTKNDTTSLVLSPDLDGNYALSANDLKSVKLRGHPVVILSACRAAVTAPHRHGSRSLAGAFIEAGASAVIASPEPIPDAEAYAFFDRVIEEINNGTSAVDAVQRERSTTTTWTHQIVVFE